MNTSEKKKLQEITNKLLEYGEELLKKENDKNEANIKNNPLKPLNPLSFLLCCIADKNVDADIAWSIHDKIKDFTFETLKNMSDKKWQDILKDVEYNRINKLIKEYKLAIDLVDKKYNGEVDKIWKNATSFAEIIANFLEFQGIGLKIATMAVNLLNRYCNIGKDFKDKYFMDISVDTHVKQIFINLGLVNNELNDTKIKNIIIYKARSMNPTAPYKLDFPCFYIGREYCKKRGKKLCKKCPIYKYCKNPDKIKQ